MSWADVPVLGGPVSDAELAAITYSAALRSASSVWVTSTPTIVASGTSAVSETTTPLAPSVVVPAQTVAIAYLLTLSVGGGTGKAILSVAHKPGASGASVVEASPSLGCTMYASAVIDVNGGRVTYTVTYSSSPSSVSWSVKVVGFLRSA